MLVILEALPWQGRLIAVLRALHSLVHQTAVPHHEWNDFTKGLQREPPLDIEVIRRAFETSNT